MRRKGTIRSWIATVGLGMILHCALVAQQPSPASDAQIQSDLQKVLKGKPFREVQAAVKNGVVTLTGSVKLLADHNDLEKRINKLHEVTSLRDQVQIAGVGDISDEQLFAKLAKGLTYDRNGYGTTAFNNIELQVHGGVVALSGIVVEPTDKTSAIGLIENTPGVRGLVDKLQVAPLSPNDRRLRLALFNAIYGAPQLNQYAIDPAKPIRIVVVNGRCTLYGVVRSTGDRDVAGIRANTVPGVFSVTNNLQVAGQRPETP